MIMVQKTVNPALVIVRHVLDPLIIALLVQEIIDYFKINVNALEICLMTVLRTVNNV